MPLSLSSKILLAIGTVGTAVFAINRRQQQKLARRRRAQVGTPKTATPRSQDASCLFKIHGEGGQKIGDSERIVNDLHSTLRTDDVRNAVIDVEPDFAEAAYEYWLHLIGNEGLDIGGPSTRDDGIRRVLNLVAGGCDWSRGLMPYTYDSPFAQVWAGIGTLGDLADANLEAKQGDEEA